MTFNEYNLAVTTAIEKKIGGTASFSIDELLLEHGFSGGFSPKVTAEVLIDNAIKKAKEQT